MRLWSDRGNVRRRGSCVGEDGLIREIEKIVKMEVGRCAAESRSGREGKDLLRRAIDQTEAAIGAEGEHG